jgi:hypothetical protein
MWSTLLLPVVSNFLDKSESDVIEGVVHLVFNSTDLLIGGVSWARVGRGLNHIATPGYKAALHASWRGWVKDEVAKHWHKPIYDAIHNNRELIFREVVDSGIKYYFIKGVVGKVIRNNIIPWFLSILVPGPGTPFQDHLGNPAIQLGEGYQDELIREQNELLAQLQTLPLTPEQVAAYGADMLARQQANARIVERLAGHRDLLWHSYQKSIADESNWMKFWGPLLLKWVVIGAATLAFEGPGFYIAYLGTSAVSTIYDAVNDLRAIKHDGKMLDQSFRFLAGSVSMAYIQLSLNTVNGFNLIRAGEMPQIAGGDVRIQAMKSFGHYRLWPHLWWAEEGSQVELMINNTKTFTTTYLLWAAYNHTSFWTGTERLLPEGALELPGSAQGIGVIPFKSREWGESPDEGSLMDLLVLGATETGLYPVASLKAEWNPVRIEQSTRRLAKIPLGYTAEQAAEAPTLPYPLSSVMSVVPGTTNHQLTIAVINPFTITVQAIVTQTLPAQFTILDAGGAQVSGNVLTWQANIEPKAGLEFRALVHWEGTPGASIEVAGPELSFRDPNTGLGDTYTAPDETVAVAWPLDVSTDFPLVWYTGQQVTLPITLTNISANITAQGSLTVTVITPEDIQLWSNTQAINIPPGETYLTSFTIPVPAQTGYVVVSGEISLGADSRQAFQEVVEIRAHRIYLPLVLRNK